MSWSWARLWTWVSAEGGSCYVNLNISVYKPVVVIFMRSCWMSFLIGRNMPRLDALNKPSWACLFDPTVAYKNSRCFEVCNIIWNVERSWIIYKYKFQLAFGVLLIFNIMRTDLSVWEQSCLLDFTQMFQFKTVLKTESVDKTRLSCFALSIKLYEMSKWISDFPQYNPCKLEPLWTFSDKQGLLGVIWITLGPPV